MRIAVLVSGSGSNLQALLDASLPVVLVVSNRGDAYALTRAREAGVPVETVTFSRGSESREDYDRRLADCVERARPDLVVLAGWMHILSPAFLDRFEGRVVNLHPALPGQFPGVNGIARALEAYRQGAITATGCMVHYAVPEVDAGPVVDTEPVAILETDDLESLSQRMHEAEHRLIVRAVKKALQAAVGASTRLQVSAMRESTSSTGRSRA